MITLLTRILWLRRSKWQFLFAGLAFALGLTIMLTALEAYLQVEKMLAAQHQKGQFLMVNKKITLVNTLGLASSTFSPEEIQSLEKAPFTQRMGRLESNHFEVTIKAKSYIRFSSVIFFEAVPDAFLDEPTPEFEWKENQGVLPIIVSQDFLNLYNFGFALSQNMPQVSREAIKLVPFDVIVSGPGGSHTFEGRIVGFSERIASVLVPTHFMAWANREIAQVKPELPSRLILQVASVSDPAIKTFLEKNRMVTDLERMQLGKTGNILQIVMQVAAILGTIFLSLAFVLFSTNFRLILAEAAADIRLLIELGYRHSAIRTNLLIYFSFFLGLMFVLAFYGVYLCNQLSGQLLQGQGFGTGSATFPMTALWVGLLFTLCVVLFNGLIIIRQLKKIA